MCATNSDYQKGGRPGVQSQADHLAVVATLTKTERKTIQLLPRFYDKLMVSS